MSAIEHADYPTEQERLRYTLGYIDKTIASQFSKKAQVDETVRATMKHFDSSDSENYITLMINTMLQDRMGIRLRNLAAARSKPYFARVDFHENGVDKKEKLYIGKTSLIRDEDQEVIIVDWRAPAANLYYEERLGRAQYVCPEGVIEGELSLKRQYTIDQGTLLEVMDIDITTNDTFLQSFLGASADHRLKEIVSTIQAEQNRVIRSDMWNPLIVQGAAGSGKTTIALHRIAYLIYTYEKSIHPESFMIIAPNKLFLNYISEVLPELGVEKVKQTTFIELAFDCIGKKMRITDPNDKLAQLTDPDILHSNERCLLQEASVFKSSLAFMRLLQRYVHILEESYLPEQDFTLSGFVLYTRNELQALFQNEYYDLPFQKRIERIRKLLQNKVKKDQEKLCSHLQSICDQRVQQLKETIPAEDVLRPEIIRTIDEKDKRIKEIERLTRTAVQDYLSQIVKKSPYQVYLEFFTTGVFKELAADHISPVLCDSIKDSTVGMLQTKTVELEDLAPVLYLKLALQGLDMKIPIEHIVVDEAQDLSVFQLLLLRRLIRGSSMTILGDLCQGIHSFRGTTNWEEVAEEVFAGKCKYLTLKQSYRTTIEIMDAANSIVKKMPYAHLPLAEPVIRHGKKPEVIHTANTKEAARRMVNTIQACLQEGYKTMAILCKTDAECSILLKHIKPALPDSKVITGREKEYPGGVVILPAYLAKGLEFDGVILANASAHFYPEDDLHAKLLYVALTRPLHALYIYYQGELSPLLSDLP